MHYISLPIYRLAFPNICPIQKQKKNAKKLSLLVKTTLAVYLIFDKLIFFETLTIFLETAIKLITGIFDLQK